MISGRSYEKLKWNPAGKSKDLYLTVNCFLLSNVLKKQLIDGTVRELSILAVRIAKFGPLKEPIRILLIILDPFSMK